MTENNEEMMQMSDIADKLEPLIDPAIRALADRLSVVDDEAVYARNHATEMQERAETEMIFAAEKEDEARRLRQVIKQLVREREDAHDA